MMKCGVVCRGRVNEASKLPTTDRLVIAMPFRRALPSCDPDITSERLEYCSSINVFGANTYTTHKCGKLLEMLLWLEVFDDSDSNNTGWSVIAVRWPRLFIESALCSMYEIFLDFPILERYCTYEHKVEQH